MDTEITVKAMSYDEQVLIQMSSGAFGCVFTVEEALRLRDAIDEAIGIALKEFDRIQPPC